MAMQAQGKLHGMKKRTMTISRAICAGIVAFTLSATATNAQTLLNPGFELPDGVFTDQANTALITIAATNWVQFANGIRTNAPTLVHSGNWSLQCFGSQDWGGEGAYQRILGASPGQQWALSGWGLTPSSDALTNIAGGSPQMPFGYLSMGFQNISSITTNAGVYTTNWNTLATSTPGYNIFGTNSALLDTWQFRSMTGTCPAGTAALIIYVMELGYGAGSQGSIYFDDLSLVNLNAPIPTNYFYETIVKGNQVCWLADTNSTYQAQSSVDNSNWVNLGAQMQGDGNTDCVFDTVLTNKFYRVLQLQ
jgi:hypothetical protein